MTATQPTGAQIQKLAEVFANGDTGYPEDWADTGINADSVTVTQDALDQFDGRHWTELEGREDYQGGIFWGRVQVARGRPRVSLAVIDCGEFRLCYTR